MQIFVLPQCRELIDASNILLYMLILIKKVIRSFKMGKFESFKTEKSHVFRIEKKSSSGFYPRVLNVLKIARTIKSPT